MIAIFDLDGTLALTEHRQHFLKEKPKNWKAFHEACVDDEPNWPIIKVCKTFIKSGDLVYIFSGRSEDVRWQTVEWLRKHGIGDLILRMRESKDFRDDRLVKREMLTALTRDRAPKITKENTLIFDNRQKVVDMWREMGLTCCQVAPGDF